MAFGEDVDFEEIESDERLDVDEKVFVQNEEPFFEFVRDFWVVQDNENMTGIQSKQLDLLQTFLISALTNHSKQFQHVVDVILDLPKLIVRLSASAQLI